MKKYVLMIIVFGFALASCTVIERSVQNNNNIQTQTQIRDYQTRTFDTNDTKLIIKSVLNVLQDDGFIVKNVVTEVGLLTATKEVDLSKKKSNDALEQFIINLASNNRNSGKPDTYSKVRVVEVSVNVTEHGKQSKVRANFQTKILDNTGNIVEVNTVDDLKFYQDFFSKVDKGIFLQKHGL